MAKLKNLKDEISLSFKELEESYKLINKYKRLFIAVGRL